MFEEHMAFKVIYKINRKLKFLYKKNSFLMPGLQRMLCNTLIQPHFDYACSMWYFNLNLKFKKTLQIPQEKNLTKCISLKRITKQIIGCLLIKEYSKIIVTIFKYGNNVCPYNVCPSWINSRNNYTRLKAPFWKINMRQKGLLCLGSSVWKKLLDAMKSNCSSNLFKYEVKQHLKKS